MKTYLFYFVVRWQRHDFSAKIHWISTAASRKMKLDIIVCSLPSSADSTIAGNCQQNNRAFFRMRRSEDIALGCKKSLLAATKSNRRDTRSAAAAMRMFYCRRAPRIPHRRAVTDRRLRFTRLARPQASGSALLPPYWPTDGGQLTTTAQG